MTYFWFALTGLKVRRPDKAFNSVFIFSFFIFFFFLYIICLSLKEQLQNVMSG